MNPEISSILLGFKICSFRLKHTYIFYYTTSPMIYNIYNISLIYSFFIITECVCVVQKNEREYVLLYSYEWIMGNMLITQMCSIWSVYFSFELLIYCVTICACLSELLAAHDGACGGSCGRMALVFHSVNNTRSQSWLLKLYGENCWQQIHLLQEAGNVGSHWALFNNASSLYYQPWQWIYLHEFILQSL